MEYPEFYYFTAGDVLINQAFVLFTKLWRCEETIGKDVFRHIPPQIDGGM